ncbi:ATP-binding component of an ABC superfamily sugar transporter [Buttiauxella ferragutiae ATCC 51602]|jgi:multiple sugar transport system ATP-binding protein|uniref:ATP-binding component of an ABC superfamily sugar transporter n=1 Tax=Buttiauxella ferragutiae ATCC 51602 TaxID=1354252 RepID=A0ABX2W257_9ENTR|nr:MULTISPECIES: sn-glycerol-3-phosphate ABC transporter ATP-binding protein UgpC [Buttiauxella]AYN27190.1 sn-glycerol-3-phosphate ABC transporter ATP-binding protein UgpC [Buttiauxella sp. 3AFRM03]MCE0825037.1 sn-glycerol-3-phosphate ABC transporter ATP-binding protein UgpC [Buttiauxella ferragutiae]OAT24589.1 ATP-binding component of an ABC superfamily sugar transporter [Buttiauxella ferragutiae ATCC 51602]TDN51860.1 multiple sugar transport system ATP-binding protein [Buttiauxella sp. JUb87]
MAQVELVKVAKNYGKVQVLKPLNLTIPDGSFTVLVGPSGCGKSTLLRLLAGLESLSDGDILLDKQQINNFDPADRDIAMVFQSYALYPHLTVAENMAFHMQVKKVPKAEQQAKVQQAAKVLGIDHLLKRLPKDLSGGQRQRVAMGRALVRNPKVFLFDEPLSNLDAQLRMELRAEIKSLHQQFRTTTVYVTHDQIEAMTLADNIVVMKDGLIVQQGDPLSIYDKPVNTFVARFIGSPPMNLLSGVFQNIGGKAGVSCNQLWFGLPEKWARQAMDCAGKPVTLGLRPHDLKPVAHSEQPAATLRLLEVTGESSLLHIDWSGFPLHVQFAGRARASTEQPLYLEANSEAIHLFDAQTGERLAEETDFVG